MSRSRSRAHRLNWFFKNLAPMCSWPAPRWAPLPVWLPLAQKSHSVDDFLFGRVNFRLDSMLLSLRSFGFRSPYVTTLLRFFFYSIARQYRNSLLNRFALVYHCYYTFPSVIYLYITGSSSFRSLAVYWLWQFVGHSASKSCRHQECGSPLGRTRISYRLSSTTRRQTASAKRGAA